MRDALDIQVRGIVQGVGFRPFVYRLARKYLVSGWVRNAADGVFIHAEAEGKLLDEFVVELAETPPAAAHVDEVELKEVPLENFSTFEIRFSDEGAVGKTTLVSPDLATCDDCARELFDPRDRRFRYPFTNCTNCGPRFTIIDGLPYDRKSTSMKGFLMCESCASEYGNPLDRRFHAQPDACFDCGPRISFRAAGAPSADIAWGSTREESDAILAHAAGMLLAGKILAVKGLGGFHLVCDGANAQAVATLRARKRREGKAFAVMMADVDAVRAACDVNEVEERMLAGSQRPIVLLRKRAGARLAPGLADGLSELGVMLPYTPLQHLLLHDFAAAKAAAADTPAGGEGGAGGSVAHAFGPAMAHDGGPVASNGAAAAVGAGVMLVMTSGNLHDEPIVTDDAEAYERLAAVADGFIGNDRAILSRYDDSVVRVVRAASAGYAVQFVRRARGFSPLPFPFAGQLAEGANGAAGCDAQPAPAGDGVPDSPHATLHPSASLFATGPEQKNTFTLTRDGEAFVSQHIGDMENAETYDAWLRAKRRFEALFGIAPTSVACDMHPEYLTSKWAHEQHLPVTEVQHHHAHVASVMGEHGLAGPVCGFAFDGTGYGVDGAIWGGEVLLANASAFERFANFAYVPMPGGAAAIRHPLRMAYGVLWAFDLLEHPGAARALAALGSQAAVCGQMIERSVNTPMTSSVGRLFDAASALLGLCTEPLYEGEGAILLEAAMQGLSDEEDSSPYAIGITKNAATAANTAQDTSVVLLDAAPAFEALLDDVAAGVSAALVSRRFHEAFVRAMVDVAELVRGLYGIEVVALSGGVFMNRYLVEHALEALERAGFTVAVNRELPPNDGCVSFGQAVVAWARNNA